MNELKKMKDENKKSIFKLKTKRHSQVSRRIISGNLPKISGKNVPFYKLYKYATFSELLSIFMSIIFATLSGFYLPANTILYSEFTTILIYRKTESQNITSTILLPLFGGGRFLTNGTDEDIKQAIIEDSVAFGVGCAVFCLFHFVLIVLCVDLMNFAALRQINRIRKMFFESILRQDMAWYDTNSDTSFASSITEDLDKMKNGIGEKIAIFLYLTSSFLVSIIICFAYGWKLTLVIISCVPIIVTSTLLVTRAQSRVTEEELQAYGFAGSVAEEILGSIRTVVAFGGENKEIERYSQKLIPAEKVGSKKGMYSGIGNAVLWIVMYTTFCLAPWYGIQLVLEDRLKPIAEYTPTTLIIIFFGVLAGAQNLTISSPHLEAFATARGSAWKIFKILDREPTIDYSSKDGLEPKSLKGDVELKNVYFNYPSRPETKILQGIHLKINPGERIALVGSSGCGKSTIVQLLQRLYDPLSGTITIDGYDITKLNVSWLRRHIGVVGQEPVLFATTISKNIALGCSNATREEIKAAAKEANCHDFIKGLPNGYETIIGERGSQLSGGQKQRIAIARALIKKPAILLLDEATSALDLQSEAKVQDALDRASFSCTTIIVSHRLTTIRNVDRIVFMRDGNVVEMGTHKELMDLKENYYNLVQADVPNDSYRESNKKNSLSTTDNNILSISDEKKEILLEESVESSKEENEIVKSISLWKILKLNSPEWPYLLTGFSAAMLVGASYPAFALIFGEFYGTLSNDDPEVVVSEGNKYSLWFFLIGLVTGVGGFLNLYMFNIAGVKLTTRMRILCFSSMLKQEIAWYDEAKNSVGALCARLSSDAAGIQGATGTWIGAILQGVSTFVIGILMSLYFTWKLTLMTLVSVPLILGAVFLEARITQSNERAEKEAMESASKVAVEAISNIRTVAGLNQEQYFIQRYLEELKNVNDALKRKTRFRGVVFAFGQSVQFLSYGLTLWYGGTLVANNEIEYKTVVKVAEALLYGAWMMGQALASTPNFNVAKISAARIFQLANRKPKIVSSPEAKTNDCWKADGETKLSKINFSYPSRPNMQILNELDLLVKAGSTIALVGGSGCGKSTCVQLIQRLYDPNSGVVDLDNKDISKDLSISLLRSQLGIVSQEPVLFDRTIEENIAYGDNSRKVSQEEIIEAAKKANIHNFIISLPLGYTTRLGVRGTQLSGGQKQRIAIARALVRNPRVLLLDEATSALDNQSEKVVQAALDAASVGRTCIIIAHRLSTVRNAQKICVLSDGRIFEQGSHEELISSNGLYHKLYKHQ